MKNQWYEVYEIINNNIDEGTQTLESFDTLEEAEQYCVGKSNVYIDKWETDENGNVIKSNQ